MVNFLLLTPSCSSSLHRSTQSHDVPHLLTTIYHSLYRPPMSSQDTLISSSSVIPNPGLAAWLQWESPGEVFCFVLFFWYCIFFNTVTPRIKTQLHTGNTHQLMDCRTCRRGGQSCVSPKSKKSLRSGRTDPFAFYLESKVIIYHSLTGHVTRNRGKILFVWFSESLDGMDCESLADPFEKENQEMIFFIFHIPWCIFISLTSP